MPNNEGKRAPHCVLFLENKKVKSMLILCGHGVSYSVNNLNSDECVFLNLFAVYYCFQINYPAMYGILPILRQLCLSVKTPPVNPPTKKGKRLKAHVDNEKMCGATKEYFEKFQNFLSQ